MVRKELLFYEDLMIKFVCLVITGNFLSLKLELHNNYKNKWKQVSRMDGCRYESNCPLMGPGTIGGLPSVGVFLRDPSPYLREFWRKPRKIPNG